MKIFLCILIGYLLGCLSPAALLSKLKKTDLRSRGTGNLLPVLITAGTGAVIVVSHWNNLRKALNGSDIQIRKFIKERLHNG